MEATLSHWADACHQQGGTVVLPHFPWPNAEPAALIATGRVDAVEMGRMIADDHAEYYRYLSAGYRLPLVGGTDKMHADGPAGIFRTYVRIPAEEPFTYDNWCKHLAAGRTFMTSGPIVRFTVDGHEIGDTVRLPGNGGAVEIEAWAECSLPVHSLQIVQEGRVVAQTVAREGTRELHLRTKVEVSEHTWLAARCGGPDYFDAPYYPDWWHRQRFAHTSPIYVAVGDGDWWMWDEATGRYMLTLIEGCLCHVRQRALRYADHTVTHHHGETDHLAYLEQPLLDAHAAVQQRIQQPRADA
jgi:hypothetical protein